MTLVIISAGTVTSLWGQISVMLGHADVSEVPECIIISLKGMEAHLLLNHTRPFLILDEM